MDSRANTHVYNDLKWLLNPVDLSNEEVHICFPDEKKINIESYRDVYLKFDQGNFIVMKLNMNVISVAKMHEEDCKVLFDNHVTIMRKNITLYIRMEKQGLY